MEVTKVFANMRVLELTNDSICGMLIQTFCGYIERFHEFISTKWHTEIDTNIILNHLCVSYGLGTDNYILNKSHYPERERWDDIGFIATLSNALAGAPTDIPSPGSSLYAYSDTQEAQTDEEDDDDDDLIIGNMDQQ